MLNAFFWGAIASGSLLAGAILAYTLKPGPRVNAFVLAVGAGLLLGSVAYDLLEDALKSAALPLVTLWFFLGSAVFILGDWLLVRSGGQGRKNPEGAQADGSSKAIVMGSVLDGIPESFVLGLTILQGSVSLPLLVAISLSNLPEGMSSSSGLRQSGWSFSRVAGMWSLVVLVSACAAAAGYLMLDPGSGLIGPAGKSVAQAFAAGALLTMLTDTMLPEAFRVERRYTGGLVTLGFAASLGLAAL